jgi:hypothetical protein
VVLGFETNLRLTLISNAISKSYDILREPKNAQVLKAVADDTRTLLSIHRSGVVPGSVYAADDSTSIIGDEEFLFDDVVINSLAYRRVMAARQKWLDGHPEFDKKEPESHGTEQNKPENRHANTNGKRKITQPVDSYAMETMSEMGTGNNETPNITAGSSNILGSHNNSTDTIIDPSQTLSVKSSNEAGSIELAKLLADDRWARLRKRLDPPVLDSNDSTSSRSSNSEQGIFEHT